MNARFISAVCLSSPLFFVLSCSSGIKPKDSTVVFQPTAVSQPTIPPKELPTALKELDKKAQDFFVKKDLVHAEKVYDKAVKIDKNEPDIYLARGRIRFEKKDFIGAEQDYSEAIKLDPKNPLAYHRRGYTRFELMKYEDAIVDLDRAIELKPDYVHAYNNRGRAKSRLNDFEGARADYEKILELDPDYVLAYLNLVDIAVETKKIDKALEICEKGDRTFIKLQANNKNLLQHQSGNLRVSMPVYQHFPMLFYNCALANKAAGNKAAALDNIDRAISLSDNQKFFQSIRHQFEY